MQLGSLGSLTLSTSLYQMVVLYAAAALRMRYKGLENKWVIVREVGEQCVDCNCCWQGENCDLHVFSVILGSRSSPALGKQSAYRKDTAACVII
ncbi:hypothetical protein ACFX1R_006126 [Malus domestica]